MLKLDLPFGIFQMPMPQTHANSVKINRNHSNETPKMFNEIESKAEKFVFYR